MVTVDGKPYWADAVGQVPFTINLFRDLMLESKTSNKNDIILKTIETGRKHGDDGVLFPKYDASNEYDNVMIEKTARWAAKYYIYDRNIFGRRILMREEGTSKLLFNY